MGELFHYSRLTTDVEMKRVELTEKEIPKVLLNNGDLLFARRSLTAEGAGKCSIVREVSEPTTFESSIIRARPNPELADSDFIYYFYSSPTGYHLLDTIRRQVAVAGITGGDLKNLELRIPPLSEQKRIARILNSLDDKIELNRQMNVTLEGIAQALFKSWFVDFVPVIDNAITAGNPIPEEFAARAETRRKALSDGTANREIAKQFPAAFQFTEEMGWIPEGWKETQIKDIAKIIKGKSYKSSELQESTTALVTLKSFNRGGGYRLDGLKEYTGGYKSEQEVFAGDLVIAYTDVTQAADVIGKPAMVVSDSRYKHLIVSLDVVVVKPFVDVHKYFLYGTAQTERFQDHTYSHSTGTTVLHLGKNAVPDYYLAIPDNKLLSGYVRVAEPTFKAIDNNIFEIRELAKLRDTLLPKLISGEIRIPEAEKLTEKALA